MCGLDARGHGDSAHRRVGGIAELTQGVVGASNKETRDGHGLGLPLARHIARLHGGEVSCISEAGEDARFALDLPAWGADQDSVSRLP